MSQGLEWLKFCDEIWVFDKDISEGMQKEIEFAKENSMVIKYIK